MKGKILKFSLFFLLFINFCNSQELTKKRYYVLSCKLGTNYYDKHAMTEYLWIIPFDSITSLHSFKQYPLYLGGFPQKSRFDCEKKYPINRFNRLSSDDFSLTDKQTLDKNELKNILKNSKKSFLTIKKSWKTGITGELQFSITPVSGDFCSSQISKESGKYIDYYGIIYLALSNFKYEPDLLNSKSYDIIIKSDFGNFDVRNE